MLEDNPGIGTVARAHPGAGRHFHGSLDLELIGTVVLGGLRGDVFENGVECQVLEGSHGNLHSHPLFNPAHLRLVNLAVEYEVVHIGHNGNRGPVIEGIALYHGVSDPYRDIQDKA